MIGFLASSAMIVAQANNDAQFKFFGVALRPFDALIPLAGALVFFIGYVLAIKCRPSVVSACFLLVPLPLLISLFGAIDQLDRSMSSSAFARAALTVFCGVLASVPGYLVIVRGIAVSYEERGANRR